MLGVGWPGAADPALRRRPGRRRAVLLWNLAAAAVGRAGGVPVPRLDDRRLHRDRPDHRRSAELRHGPVRAGHRRRRGRARPPTTDQVVALDDELAGLLRWAAVISVAVTLPSGRSSGTWRHAEPVSALSTGWPELASAVGTPSTGCRRASERAPSCSPTPTGRRPRSTSSAGRTAAGGLQPQPGFWYFGPPRTARAPSCSSLRRHDHAPLLRERTKDRLVRLSVRPARHQYRRVHLDLHGPTGCLVRVWPDLRDFTVIDRARPTHPRIPDRTRSVMRR